MSGYSFTPEQDALIQAIWGATTMKARRDAMATLFAVPAAWIQGHWRQAEAQYRFVTGA